MCHQRSYDDEDDDVDNLEVSAGCELSTSSSVNNSSSSSKRVKSSTNSGGSKFYLLKSISCLRFLIINMVFCLDEEIIQVTTRDDNGEYINVVDDDDEDGDEANDNDEYDKTTRRSSSPRTIESYEYDTMSPKTDSAIAIGVDSRCQLCSVRRLDHLIHPQSQMKLMFLCFFLRNHLKMFMLVLNVGMLIAVNAGRKILPIQRNVIFINFFF